MNGHAEFHPGAFRRGLRHAGLTHGEYRVAVELAEHASPDRPTVWPSVPTLMEICGMTDRGVRQVLTNLEAKGVIACPARIKGGRGHTNHWRLLVIPTPKTLTEGAGFTDPETLHDGSGFTTETLNENAAKPCTKTHETLNDGSGEVVRSSKKRSSKESGPRSRATRLPADWMPDPQVVKQMSDECPHVDLKASHRKFADHWTAKAGRDATKLDWNATWRNWIREDAQRASRGTNGQRPKNKLRATAELAAQMREDEAAAKEGRPARQLFHDVPPQDPHQVRMAWRLSQNPEKRQKELPPT
jgi:hypothetical protein